MLFSLYHFFRLYVNQHSNIYFFIYLYIYKLDYHENEMEEEAEIVFKFIIIDSVI